MQRDFKSGISGTVKTQVTPFGSFTNSNHTGRRHEVILRIFRINTTFDSCSAKLNIILFIRQRISGSNCYHIPNQVNSRTFLRHRMFYLQTGIHLEEVEVLVFIHHKLQCPGTVISYFLTGFHSNLQHFLSRLFFHKRRRTFLYHFLVTALNGTFTFVKMDHIAIFISHDLNFDMMGILDVFLNIYRIIAKRSPCFGLRQTKSRFHFFFRAYQAHSFSSTSGKCFQHNGITYFIGHLLHFINPLHRCLGSGNNG